MRWLLRSRKARPLGTLVGNIAKGNGSGLALSHGYKGVTEIELYILATILKSPYAVRAALAIIETLRPSVFHGAFHGGIAESERRES